MERDDDEAEALTEAQALRAELRALQGELKSLRGEMAALRSEIGPRVGGATMRTLIECPHCGGRRVLEVQRVSDRTDAGDVPLAVASKGFFTRKPVGPLRCWICAACGFTEWYVEGPQELTVDDETISAHEVDDAERGPYR